MRLVRPGGLVVADNVFSGGRVAAPAGEREPNAQALAGFTAVALSHPRLAHRRADRGRRHHPQRGALSSRQLRPVRFW